MKKLLRLLCAALAALPLFALQSCLKDSCRRTYKIYQPVYKTLTQVRAGMHRTEPRALENTGKLNLFGSTIFLNEVNKGIHIIDNSNPAAPKNIGFLNIPGNVDLAVKGNYLYADSYSDIVVFDISAPANTAPVKFLNNVIKEKNVYWHGLTANPDSLNVVVGYTERDTTVDCNSNSAWGGCPNCMTLANSASFYSAAAGATQTGVGGSMASFTVVNNYLYAVGSASLYSINISNPREPQPTAVRNLGWGIETIYPFQNKLFIGSRTGMFIFDLSNPASPTQQGQFSHATRCDPVIADGGYAYVTLRGGTTCNGTTSELNVIDVSNLSVPVLKKRHMLTGPYGLAKDGNLLFVCDGTAGLKIYNAADPLNLQLTKQLTDLETYDVIALNNRAVVVARDGLYQYDYSNPSAVSLISKLSIAKK